MTQIKIDTKAQDDGWQFQVEIIQGKSRTSHQVTMSKATYEKLTGGKVTPEACVQKSFEFLLEQEPKESILRQFDITEISYYFPDFEQQLKRKW